MNIYQTKSKFIGFYNYISQQILAVAYFNKFYTNKVALSSLLGAGYVLAFAPFHWYILAFLSQFGLIILVKNASSLKQAFTVLFSFNLVVVLLNFYWIFFSINYVLHSNLLTALTYFGFMLLHLLFYLPLIFLKTNKAYSLLFVGKVFIALGVGEILKLYLLNGFPWLIMPAIYGNNLVLSQGVYMFGVNGFNVINLVLLALLFVFKIKHYSFFNRIMCFTPMIFIFLFIILFGYLKLNLDIVNNQAGQKTSIRLVNTAVKQNDKFDINLVKDTFYTITNNAFSNISASNPPQYIIFPEVAFGFILQDHPQLWQYFLSKIPAQTTVFLGAIREHNNRFYNSIYIINGQTKEITYVYDKKRLVPFGEYIPLTKYLPWLNTLGFSNLAAGTGDDITSVNGIKFALSICFEGIFNNDNFNYKNVDILINISNEAWFNSSKELQQYNSLLKMRALAGNIPVVKATNYGQAVVFSKDGKIVFSQNVNDFSYKDLEIEY